MADVPDYGEAYEWCREHGGKQHLLLGNGFSMAFDSHIFGYQALAQQAEVEEHLSTAVRGLMASIDSEDFEATMRSLESTILTLTAINAGRYERLIGRLKGYVDELRNALAHSIAGLHPARPSDIDKSRYASVRRFIQPFENIYTVNYDLLLYWALMQDFSIGDEQFPSRSHDDGFRDSGVELDDTVLWDIYDNKGQSISYIHGALHLYEGHDGLRKLTWSRTGEALIDQTLLQLQQGRYPLYVAEADSARKLDRISHSGYLARALRSLRSISGSVTVYGHSLDANDDHVFEAIVRSSVKRIAVSLFGSRRNQADVVAGAEALIERREARGGSRTPLEVMFYDARSVGLWQ